MDKVGENARRAAYARLAGTDLRNPGCAEWFDLHAAARERGPCHCYHSALSAWEVYGAARLPPADSVTCRDLVGLSASDRGYPRVLIPSGTQRARALIDP